MKVKAKYLADKAIQNPTKPKEELQVITDFDLIHFDLFEMILAQFQNKQNEKKQTIISYISELHSIVAKVVSNLDSSANDKTKKTVEQSVLSAQLNKTMETKNVLYFGNNFKHRILYQVFVKAMKNENDGFTSPA